MPVICGSLRCFNDDGDDDTGKKRKLSTSDAVNAAAAVPLMCVVRAQGVLRTEHKEAALRLLRAACIDLLALTSVNSVVLHEADADSIELLVVACTTRFVDTVLAPNGREPLLTRLQRLVPDSTCALYGSATSNAPPSTCAAALAVTGTRYAAATVGYVLHPTILAAARRNADEMKTGDTTAAAAVENKTLGTTAAGDQSEPRLFEVVRNEYTKRAELLRFAKSAPGRSPHRVAASNTSSSSSSSSLSLSPSSSASSSSTTLDVPLLHALRKLTGVNLDIEIDFEVLYCQLARLRSLRDDISAVNALAATGVSIASTDNERVMRVVRTI